MELSEPSSLPATTGKEQDLTTNVLVVGGSYAGLSAIKAFRNNILERDAAGKTNGQATPHKRISITLVEPRAGLLNILGVPKAIVDPEFAKTQYVPFGQLQGLTFDHTISTNDEVRQTLSSAHANQKEAKSNEQLGLELTYIQGKVNYLSETSAKYILVDENDHQLPEKTSFTISFDTVILASGRDRSWPITPDAFNFDSYMGEMKKARDEIASAESITVIGAGAVGIELAGDIKHSFPKKTVNLIHPHPSFPAEPLSDDFKLEVQKSLQNGGVKLHPSTRIEKELPNGDLLTTENKVISSNLNQWCTSHKNNTHILSPSLQKSFVTPQNNVIVNDYLQLTNTHTTIPQFFVLGDLVELPIIKSAGWAMYMGRAVAANIISLIFDKVLIEPFPDLTKMPLGMVIVAGNGEIVSELAGVVELNNDYYVKEYKDYCIGKIRATLDV